MGLTNVRETTEAGGNMPGGNVPGGKVTVTK